MNKEIWQRSEGMFTLNEELLRKTCPHCSYVKRKISLNNIFSIMIETFKQIELQLKLAHSGQQSQFI